MAIKLFDEYAPRANVGDGDYPFGSIKNESTPGANDGTPLDENWGNDMVGFTDALLDEAGITPSGVADTVNVSDRLDAINTLILNSALGVNQSWQDMTVGRAFGVTYTNTTGKPISASIIYNTALDTGSNVIITVGGLNIYTESARDINYAHQATGFAIIPDGATYAVSTSGASTLTKWYELRS